MSWPRGRRRADTPCAAFVARLIDELGVRELARRCGVCDRTVRRWRDGERWTTGERLSRLCDVIWPQSVGSAPIYSPGMAIDGHTRVGGVGEYSRRAARGDLEYVGGTDDDR